MCMVLMLSHWSQRCFEYFIFGHPESLLKLGALEGQTCAHGPSGIVLDLLLRLFIYTPAGLRYYVIWLWYRSCGVLAVWGM